MNEEYYLIHFSSFSTGYKNNSNRDDIGFNNLLGIMENGFRFSKGRTFTPMKPNGKLGPKLQLFIDRAEDLYLESLDQMRHVNLYYRLYSP
jgi:hypothetical protein